MESVDNKRKASDNEDRPKRVKTGENTEALTHEEKKEYGGLECDLKNIVFISYVRNKEDLENLGDLKSFPATFPENLLQTENLKGIKNPKIRLFFTPNRLRVYLNYSYEKRAPNYDEPDVKIIEHFTDEGEETKEGEEQKTPEDIITQDVDIFESWVNEELSRFEPTHTVIDTFEHENGKKFEILKITRTEEIFSKKFNNPYQYHLFIDIDNTSVIENDPYWHYYILFDVTKGYKTVAGFVSIYKSYQNIMKYRTRISQFIIFPDYQKQGLAYKLHDLVYMKFMSKPECFEITMESPTPVMSKIYNRCVLTFMLKNGKLDKLLTSAKKEFITVDQSNIKKVLARTMDEMTEMAVVAKCEPICASRIYEFLVCKLIAEKDDVTFEILSQYVKKR